ncbi:MAG: matrixin family metalloprotease [Planctomycetaceae bacterium]|nr:matrixin family metalloprotease [Planctomycetaceae bacterium]
MRTLLTTLNWADTKTLTISFAPDGTDVAGNSNRLNQMMDQIAPRDEWHKAITSAFQTWLNEVGMSFQVVSDSGDAFGIAGATHGDTRFGDVRVGATPLSDNALATAIPGDQIVSGTWASDILFNSNDTLTTLDEVYALALHEAGHVLGLGHNPDSNSPMYANAGTVVHTPTTLDLQNLRRQFQISAGGSGEQNDDSNGKASGAQQLAATNPVGLDPRFEGSGTIVTATDVDTFRFRPADLGQTEDGTATIVLETALNGFIPKVTLQRADGKLVESTIVANGNGRVVLQARDLKADRDYIVVVESASKTNTIVAGRYQLSVSFSQPPVTFDRLASGTIEADRTQQVMMLYSARSQMVNFVFSAKGSSRRDAVLVLSIYDSSDKLVYQTAAKAGDTVTGTSVLLHTGEYRIAVDGVAPGGTAMPQLDFLLKSVTTSIDAGPIAKNTTLNPSFGNGGTSPYVFPGNVISNRPINVQQPTTPTVLPPARPTVVWNPNLLNYPWLVTLQ